VRAVTDDPHLARIRTYPVKSLTHRERGAAGLDARGALAGDREYAIVAKPADAPHDADAASPAGDGDYVNGKRTAAVHRLDASLDREADSLTLAVDGERRAFDVADGERGPLNEWLSEFFGDQVSVRREPVGGQPDDRDSGGPTVVSTATLRTVADWTDLAVESVRRRFRANLEVGGVEPFWEDRLYGAEDPRPFRIGDVRFEGVAPCTRCVVPPRDPDTGEETPGFRETFLRRREATLPEWAPAERFDGYYKLAVATRVPDAERGGRVAVGDPVAVG